MVAVFNQILEDSSLSPSQKLAIIILIFKKGNPRVATNYRPILLTNCDYKILAYVFVKRIEPFLSEIIHSNQTAYMKEQFIGSNVRSVQDVIDTNGLDSLVVLFLDFHKAFDSVNHLFMMSLLIHMGFPNIFVPWMLVLYKLAMSCVWHKGWLTEFFFLKQGVHQGCLLSCHLFNLVGQVLIYSLRDHGYFGGHFWGIPVHCMQMT